MPLTGEVLRFFDPNVRSLAHFLADSVLGMEQHILKYEFHISKVLKFIEIY